MDPRAAPKIRAYSYLRLSVDKEEGNAQSIEAQRHAFRAYALKNGIKIVEEFADTGLSGQSTKRPAFNRMIEQATDGANPVNIVLIYRIARLARNMRLFFASLEGLADVGVEVIAITENFGESRGTKRMGQTISAMVAEQQAIDSSTYTSKSRSENARQGFYNGGPVAFGYETYVARKDGDKERMKLRVVLSEAAVVDQIFEWADMGRGGRWIVGDLNRRGTTLRGAKFSNSNLSGILSRVTYTGVYYDRTVDDDGNVPDPEDWIAVPCPVIIDQPRFAAGVSQSAPRRTAYCSWHHDADRNREMRNSRLQLCNDDPHGQRRTIQLLRLRQLREQGAGLRDPKHSTEGAGRPRVG